LRRSEASAVDGVALVLAAGRGTRMGGPKALMRAGGGVWWRVQQARLSEAGVKSLWVVSPEVEAAMVAEDDAPPLRAMGDPAAPMFASVVAGVLSLRDAPPRGVFVLPVDVPAAGAGVWAALSRSDVPAAPVWRGERGHPVYLPWGWVASELLALVDAGGVASARLDRLLEGWVSEVEVDDPGVLVNLNTPADVARWSA
jgi:molybdenum cofactor cytidylyltransferase